MAVQWIGITLLFMASASPVFAETQERSISVHATKIFQDARVHDLSLERRQGFIKRRLRIVC